MALLGAVLLLARARGEEQNPPPSQKTKQAIEALHRVPTNVRTALGKFKEAAKAKLQAALKPISPGGGKGGSSVPEAPQEPKVQRYSPVGKRDPFRPLALERTKVKQRARENLSPLEQYDISQLKLVGIIWNIKEPKAMVEDGSGLGYIIKAGTPIGKNGGKVKTINPKEVVIEENYIDFLGTPKSREVKLRLASELAEGKISK